MSLLSGINHAAFITKDLRRFIDFYTTMFDAQLIFEEATPELCHAMLRVGDSVLHPAELPASPYAQASSAMFQRGHVDHLGLTVRSRTAFEEVRRRLVEAGASKGAVSDLGPLRSFWFQDPDGMQAEVCWVSDAELRGFHAPAPLASEAPAP
jgi:catechol 2,3-dioxygenase-like lactoylglutathione lyase family enzyme